MQATTRDDGLQEYTSQAAIKPPAADPLVITITLPDSSLDVTKEDLFCALLLL